jgi:hypothetical protein
MEAITNRPLLLAAVGRAAQSGGQTTLHLTPLHGKANLIKPLIANIHAALRYVKEAAEAIKSTDTWSLQLRYVSDKIVPMIGPFSPNCDRWSRFTAVSRLNVISYAKYSYWRLFYGGCSPNFVMPRSGQDAHA